MTKLSNPEPEQFVPGQDAQMDLQDLTILHDILVLHDALDPMPEMLPDIVLFALQAHDLDAELARLVDAELNLVGAAGTRAAVEHARRVTFASDHLTVMVAVHPQPDSTVRLDGWAAPGGSMRAELRTSDGVHETACDADGRFVFEGVPHGPAQLVLHPTADSDPDVSLPVVTPAVHL